MTDLDQFRNRQSKLLLMFALTFGLWQLTTLLVEVGNATGALQHTFIGTMIFSGFAWFVTAVTLFGDAFSKKGKSAKALAQDEWQKHISANAISYSYLSLIFLIGAGVLWTVMVGPLDGEIVFRVLLILAVLIPLILNATLDKFSGGSVDD